ncbi:uncharacterized protein LOC130647179 [Hydractinia symbiolongicarpus]|uniref:uncharacterized protein LOC130647179 n=1 Tax=Hydractinia symbiolongicarpus TaxID=13093 RepID=UPI00254C9A8B|nr:uncharacterized protein LOC130647179 [Hydractinia symbiolongicarpus]XP_057308926.1 uncharacterized protein LOC130647179 [Hydractinia symbiolongicarpus]
MDVQLTKYSYTSKYVNIKIRGGTYKTQQKVQKLGRKNAHNACFGSCIWGIVYSSSLLRFLSCFFSTQRRFKYTDNPTSQEEIPFFFKCHGKHNARGAIHIANDKKCKS